MPSIEAVPVRTVNAELPHGPSLHSSVAVGPCEHCFEGFSVRPLQRYLVLELPRNRDVNPGFPGLVQLRAIYANALELLTTQQPVQSVRRLFVDSFIGIQATRESGLQRMQRYSHRASGQIHLNPRAITPSNMPIESSIHTRSHTLPSFIDSMEV
jgi:hypothetical protein